MKKKFLIVPFLLLFSFLSFNFAYAQEDTETPPEEDSVEIQIMQTEEETDDAQTTEEEVVELPVYTKEEVAEHNVPQDCWMSFEGMVW